ncbi:hypothetical protein CAEBREN_29802 [Caenorhabditis brenneri]|uniref:Uncharacterized protein n=1 Tax=Caenorhabditis brenneri TaxID=135651 RepID=G0MQ82_CAEBE|nr:hypothetical protein CAEBREN_29802 [Caenorhabditis brenneri]
MPPRKAKKDPEVTKVAEELADPIKQLIVKLKENILDAARKTATEESKRVLEKIPEKYHKMPIMELLNMGDVPFDFFGALSQTPEENEEEEEGSEGEEEEKVEEPEAGKENEQQDVEMDIDDAAHETSIPIAHSVQNSGRNTALDAQRNEIITPAGTAIPVPTLNPFKPFRTVHSGEEFAFSVNGSPLVLAGIAAANKKNTRPLKKSNPQKKTTAEAGLLVPKEEGTSV